MKVMAFWSFFSAVLLLNACSSFNVDSDYDSDYDFKALKTYQWHAPNEYTQTTKSYLNNDILDKRIRENVNADLQASGYTLATSGQPDFYVNYSVSSEPRVDVDTYNVYGGFYPGWSYGHYGPGPYYYGGIGMNYGAMDTETRVTHYQQGTLVLDIVDPQSSKLVWRGTADGRIPKNLSPAEKEQAVKDVVAKVLSNFPPK